MTDKQQILKALDEKIDAKTKEELIAHVSNEQMRERLIWTKSLVDIFGKEQAKKVIHNTLYPIWYAWGRETAVAMGCPQDLDGFIKMREGRAGNPIVPPSEIVEKTKTRYVTRTNRCFIAEAYFRYKENKRDYHKFGGDDVFEAVKSRCDMDTARWNGFNPKIKVTRTKFFFDGDDCCEFVCELERI
jgi:hypothetical protein